MSLLEDTFIISIAEDLPSAHMVCPWWYKVPLFSWFKVLQSRTLEKNSRIVDYAKIEKWLRRKLSFQIVVKCLR
jgi:hypothetical protein